MPGMKFILRFRNEDLLEWLCTLYEGKLQLLLVGFDYVEGIALAGTVVSPTLVQKLRGSYAGEAMMLENLVDLLDTDF